MGTDETTQRAYEKRLARNTPPRDAGPDPAGVTPFTPDRPGVSPAPERIDDRMTRLECVNIIAGTSNDGPPVIVAVANEIELVPHIRRRWSYAWQPIIEVVPHERYRIGVGVEKARGLVSLWRPKVVICDGIAPDQGLRGSQRTVVIEGQGTRNRPRPRYRQPIISHFNSAPAGWRPPWVT